MVVKKSAEFGLFSRGARRPNHRITVAMQSKDVNEILSDIEKLKNVLSSDVNLESDFVKAKTSDFITFLEKEAKDAMESSKFEREAPEAKTMKMSVNDENVDSVGFRRWAESKVVPQAPKRL